MAKAQNARHARGQIDNGGLNPNHRRIAIEHPHRIAKLLRHVLSTGRADAPEFIRRRCGNADVGCVFNFRQLAQDILKHSMIGRAQRDGVLPSRDARVNRRIFGQYQSKRPREKRRHQRMGQTPNLIAHARAINPMTHVGIGGNMCNQWMIGRTIFQRENLRDCQRIARIGRQAIDRLGR